ncbi:hypothetical protein LCGC14_1548440 [marine sediment metagenome]|uniref:Uncharacterized protein n=1 Tax=marine sediment metagenome TaxID=412755 RepID=A0A0F9LRY0_9ZZZZ
MKVDKHDGLVATVRIARQEADFLINCVHAGLSMTPGIAGRTMGSHLLEELEVVSRPVKFFPMKDKKT